MEDLSVIALTYEIHKKLIELATAIDKKYRHTLAEPSITHITNVLRQLILAKHAPKPLKASYLLTADAEAELCALTIRTMLELHVANDTNILKTQAKLTEARKQIGGWRKSVQ
jgi:hypothetical protein